MHRLQNNVSQATARNALPSKRHSDATLRIPSDLPENLTPVREAHLFDEARLADYMTANVEGFRGPCRCLQFEGGQSNPTFHLTDGGGRMYVLRKKPPGKLLPSAHQVDREYRVIKALSDHTDVPVPKPYALCQDDSVIGTAFYIMEFLPGRILADPKMPGISPADRGKIFDSMNDVLARLHNVDYRAVGLGDYGREGQYIQRQIARWTSQYDLARTDNVEVDGAAEAVAAGATFRRATRRASTTATTASATPSSIRPSRASSRCSTGSCRRSAIRWPTSATTA